MIFISYNSEVIDKVAKAVHCLQRQTKVEIYFHPDKRTRGRFWDQLDDSIRNKCDRFVLFISKGSSRSKPQEKEISLFLRRHGDSNVVVVLLDGCQIPSDWDNDLVEKLKDIEHIRADTNDPNWPLHKNREILDFFQEPYASFDDLPTLLEVVYEKELINDYIVSNGTLPAGKIAIGYPEKWPNVSRRPASCPGWTTIDNPLDPQTHRPDNSAILVDARIRVEDTEANVAKKMTFPEAGPRGMIFFKTLLTVGILVSGGIAPGINAVISAIVKKHEEYQVSCKNSTCPHEVVVYGYREGFKALLNPVRNNTKLKSTKIDELVNLGGSLLPTSRADELLTLNPVKRHKLLKKMAKYLHEQGVDILYIIGGEGSMRAAHALSTVYDQEYPDVNLSVIGVPKTMDNDILWVWQSFGFVSAVEKARENIIQLHTEVTSNPRVGVVQLFGTASGFVVSHAAFGSNVCHLALIPELVDYTMRDVCARISEVLLSKRAQELPPSALLVMAETALPGDWEQYKDKEYVGLTEQEKIALCEFDKKGKRFIGQTPDHLRSACLKIVSRVLKQYIQKAMGKGETDTLGFNLNNSPTADEYWTKFRVLTNEPRHLIRSMAPSVTDVAFGVRLGIMAVDMAMAGYRDCMVSQWLTEYVVVPLKLVALGRKRVPLKGIFWRTVVSKTGQYKYRTLTDIIDKDEDKEERTTETP
jgi:6-phosphofructokinase 1